MTILPNEGSQRATSYSGRGIVMNKMTLRGDFSYFRQRLGIIAIAFAILEKNEKSFLSQHVPNMSPSEEEFLIDSDHLRIQRRQFPDAA